MRPESPSPTCCPAAAHRPDDERHVGVAAVGVAVDVLSEPQRWAGCKNFLCINFPLNSSHPIDRLQGGI